MSTNWPKVPLNDLHMIFLKIAKSPGRFWSIFGLEPSKQRPKRQTSLQQSRLKNPDMRGRNVHRRPPKTKSHFYPILSQNLAPWTASGRNLPPTWFGPRFGPKVDPWSPNLTKFGKIIEFLPKLDAVSSSRPPPQTPEENQQKLIIATPFWSNRAPESTNGQLLKLTFKNSWSNRYWSSQNLL